MTKDERILQIARTFFYELNEETFCSVDLKEELGLTRKEAAAIESLNTKEPVDTETALSCLDKGVRAGYYLFDDEVEFLRKALKAYPRKFRFIKNFCRGKRFE